MSSGETVDNEYKSREGQKGDVPVQDDNAPVEDPIDEADADSDKALEKDEAEAIDKTNIVEGRTRGAAKSYREPGDDEGIPEDA